MYLGYQAGSFNAAGLSSSILTGSYNTFIGSQSVGTNVDVSNSSCLGYGCVISGSNQIVLGTPNETTYIKGQLILNLLRCTTTTIISTNVPSTWIAEQ